VTEGHTNAAPRTDVAIGRLSWHGARAAAFAAASTLPSERVHLADAIGRVLAEDVLALHDVPHYPSSAMDGWAVSGDGPWTIVPGGSSLREGSAAAIVTGGLIPDGTSGVLRRENAIIERGVLSTESGEPWPGQHIRLPGREALRDERVISAGVTVNPAHVALAAGCGYDALAVSGRPRVAFVFTGDEVVERGIPAPGMVRDSFGPQLPALLRMFGAVPASSRRVLDSLADTVAAIAADSGADEVVITTGGTGDSAVDHIRPALAELDARMLVDGIGMRPGGPTMLAQLPDGRYVVALPGNPLAAIMGVLTVVAPLIAGLAGCREPTLGSAISADDLRGKDGASVLMPYRLVAAEAVVDAWHGSAMMRGLAQADGVLVVPPDGAKKGDVVETVALPWS
jgi:molybdopterin molybdotransferase